MNKFVGTAAFRDCNIVVVACGCMFYLISMIYLKGMAFFLTKFLTFFGELIDEFSDKFLDEFFDKCFDL